MKTNNYWISYQAELQEDSLRLTTSFAHSNRSGEGYIRVPQTWSFDLAIPEGLPQPFDTSSTFGMLGSIDGQSQVFSESFERALGDVLTILTCEIIDFLPAPPQDSRIVFLGPPFPKLVGRLLSLRLDPLWRIQWFSAPGVLGLIGPDLDLEVLARTILCSQMSSWEDEPLLEVSAGDGLDSRVPSWLTLGASGQRTDIESCLVSCGTVKLPVELAAALSQVMQHRIESYSGEAGEEMRQDAVGDIPTGLAVFAGSRRRPPSQAPSWSVRWPHILAT